jgi:cardiolipin synthase
MLEAISAARHSIALTTYIFDNDDVGRQFAEALIAAHARGVAVRVIIDAVGQHYTWPSMIKRLRTAGVPAAAYMPILMNRNLAALNLRNHRKLLILDGESAFTGGMNIRGGNLLAKPSTHPVRDLQFRIRGPVVQELMSVFVSDWEFVTRETLSGASWFPPLKECGPVIARAIPDGPDEYFEVLKMIILGGLAQARRSVLIATPYFLPDAGLISALNTTALRGVAVEILLPEKNNLKLVQWASFTLYWQLLDRGCRVWHSPPPFDHSKLMLVDDQWALVGSTNWDPRSMRLNFELNLECYSTELGTRMRAWFERRREEAREISQADMDNRRLARRLRDGVARLLSPYL